MPHISKKARLIRELEDICTARLHQRQMRAVADVDEPLEDNLDVAMLSALANAKNSRYVFWSSKYRKGDAEDRFQGNLGNGLEASDSDVTDEVQPWLNDEEFLQKYRVYQSSFQYILNKIKDHPIFHTGKKKKQAPVSYQLMTWLKYVRTEGIGASNPNQRNTFGIGKGTAEVYRDQVTKAIQSLYKEYVY
jgi:hypothetical protein